MHLVHRGEGGDPVVVGILFNAGEDPDESLAALIHGGEPSAAPASETLDLTPLIPDDLGFWTYAGSLTTPPCSEPVRWIVLQARRTVSAEQLARLDRFLTPNARPVMSLGGSEVEVGFRAR